MRKIINHHIEGGTWKSHPFVQDLQHPGLGKPRRGLQILDTQMRFPLPSLNVVLDSINPRIYVPYEMLSHPATKVYHLQPRDECFVSLICFKCIA